MFYSIGTTQDKSLPHRHFLQTLSLLCYSQPEVMLSGYQLWYVSTCPIGRSIIVICTIHFNYKLQSVPLCNSTALLRTYPTSYTFEWSEEKVQTGCGIQTEVFWTPLKCVTDTIETQFQVKFKRIRRTSRDWVKGVSSKSWKSISVLDFFVGNRKTKLFRRRTGFFIGEADVREKVLIERMR